MLGWAEVLGGLGEALMVVEVEAEASGHHSANPVHQGREGSRARLRAQSGLEGRLI